MGARIDRKLSRKKSRSSGMTKLIFKSCNSQSNRHRCAINKDSQFYVLEN